MHFSPLTIAGIVVTVLGFLFMSVFLYECIALKQSLKWTEIWSTPFFSLTRMKKRLLLLVLVVLIQLVFTAKYFYALETGVDFEKSLIAIHNFFLSLGGVVEFSLGMETFENILQLRYSPRGNNKLYFLRRVVVGVMLLNILNCTFIHFYSHSASIFSNVVQVALTGIGDFIFPALIIKSVYDNQSELVRMGVQGIKTSTKTPITRESVAHSKSTTINRYILLVLLDAIFAFISLYSQIILPATNPTAFELRIFLEIIGPVFFLPLHMYALFRLLEMFKNEILGRNSTSTSPVSGGITSLIASLRPVLSDAGYD